MNNVELVKQAYQNFAQGNIEAVLEFYHPEMVWHNCSGYPFITGDGLFIGPDAVVQNVFAKMPEYIDSYHVDIQELFGSGDKVVMVGHYIGVWKETGKKFKANAAHVWTLKDGKVTHFFQAADTAEIVNP